MGRLYPKKSSVEWKTTGNASLSPNHHLLVIFGIVTSLLCLSQFTRYMAQQKHTLIYFQLFLLLSPILLILLFFLYSTCRGLNFRFLGSFACKLKRTYLAAAAALALAFLLIFILF
ncbi:hypothetical protein VNO77_35892 [Canavalia gladiata]|uniref:Transmembrane protein n=1 Tax=Canavalia gladiata TaxID=3824 RepID=A0AAN9PVD8_CANGL